MIRRFVALSLALSLLASGAAAQAPVAAKPAKVLMGLTAEDIDPARLLPPPPEAGSVAEKAELAELHDIQDHRTAARYAQAQWDAEHETWALFADQLGPQFDPAQLPATARVLAVVQNDQAIAANRAKDIFRRARPWAADSSIVGCEHQGTNPLSSYPSGHTTTAYALGLVLADLMPQKAQAILSRASDYAYSRMVCGMHYRSDTMAGEALGSVVAVDILHNARMQADLAAARAELKTVGLTSR